eukprot:TRINITY_DN41512_c0_g1_i1.p1 TRINITY_DN41512_c0_g1~~TRINITY_DN41512_c0_g1_i1.p1  ORF type:complete len:214 (+),score=40.12 TRINITY_DN41512_c0_g1_i1:82-642(+)
MAPEATTQTIAAVDAKDAPAAALKPWADTSSPLFICGTDRRARPTLVARPSAHAIPGTDEESTAAAMRCMDVVRYCFDHMDVPEDEKQTMVIFDLAGAGLWNLDLTFSRVLIKGLVEEFPGRVKRIFVVNVGWAASAAWTAIRAFLETETAEKVTFCGGDYKEKLLEHIDESHPYLRHMLDGTPLK